ncbi:MAG: EamA/RhaT family transporter [Xanthobacteraceae bacterium]|nr:MAG: EamA/RhaT family transporter [Xanthobacteraceae bacterium]
MIAAAGLWIPFTLLGAAGQVARNAMQRELTGTLGTVGATHVRFLFGCPFALAFLAMVLGVTGAPLPRPDAAFWLWLTVAALTQIVGTALMLAAMHVRSFVVTTAYLKTEPLQAALFGFVFLADALGAARLAAIVVASIGVVVTALGPGGARGFGDPRPTAMGLAAAAVFALSAVGFRGAILALPATHFVVAATVTLAAGLVLQSVLLSAYLALRSPGTLTAIVRQWRPSLLAGFLGALASQFWFLAFALTAAANVRTLALVEVLFAQGLAHVALGQKITAREAAGIALIVIGVALLIAV